jgi:lipid A disaccharide synthetase
MVTEEMSPREQDRTNVYIIDPEAWAWAKYRADTLKYKTTSEYIFALIKADREKNILKKGAP